VTPAKKVVVHLGAARGQHRVGLDSGSAHRRHGGPFHLLADLHPGRHHSFTEMQSGLGSAAGRVRADPQRELRDLG